MSSNKKVYHYGRRQGQRSPAQGAETSTESQEPGIFRSGPNGNLGEWEQMTLYRFHNEYKEFASAIEDEKWSVVAEKFDEAEIKKMIPTITASAIEKLQVDAVNRHFVKQSKHLETVTAMYGNLMMHLSSASNEMVENDAEFGKVKAAKDAVGLWKIIKKTHATE